MKKSLLILLLLSCGCASIPPMSEEQKRSMDDEFRRAHENPIPPGFMVPVNPVLPRRD